jgi:hypothetical protein
VLVLILRDARRPIRLCRAVGARALLRMRTDRRAALRLVTEPLPWSYSHDVKQPISFPRRVFCARGLHRCFAHPHRGVGGAPRDVRVLGGTPVGVPSARHKTRVNALMTRHARRLRGALRPITRDARLSALHRGGFRHRGRASLTGICAGSVTAISSQPGRSAWRAASRASRGERLRAACRGTPRLAPHSGSSLEHALNERGWEAVYHRHIT